MIYNTHISYMLLGKQSFFSLEIHRFSFHPLNFFLHQGDRRAIAMVVDEQPMHESRVSRDLVLAVILPKMHFPSTKSG